MTAAAGTLTVLAAALTLTQWRPVQGRHAGTAGPPAEPAGADPESRAAPLQLRAPKPGPWPPAVVPRMLLPPNDQRLRAQAFHLEGLVFRRPRDNSLVAGIVRRGTSVGIRSHEPGSGCKGGRWYQVVPRGYVCTRQGFNVSSRYRPELQSAVPDVSRSLPYRYAKAVRGAPRYYRRPSPSEERSAQTAIQGAKHAKLPDVVSTIMDGAYFLAFPSDSKPEQRGFVQTVRGRVVRTRDLQQLPAARMRGELLSSARALPLAFVHLKSAVVRRQVPGGTRDEGRAEQFARFHVAETFLDESGEYLVSDGGHLVGREAVRIARRIARPAAIPRQTKWIHIDLGEQTLVAYEDDRPVYATLVSSGKPPNDTPPGTFRIREKHISITMSGPDPDVKYYEVEEAPWTMYYHDGFALHGAYWHNEFGNVRSHGCTNLPPGDARWLWHWVEPDLPAGWHGVWSRKGTRVHITPASGS
ncbi:MAG: L,D-transpeptidase [Proteobacteria bacterium]|nr:L,D-transpeptidase [Pseudomonadota bacterium]